MDKKRKRQPTASGWTEILLFKYANAQETSKFEVKSIKQGRYYPVCRRQILFINFGIKLMKQKIIE